MASFSPISSSQSSISRCAVSTSLDVGTAVREIAKELGEGLRGMLFFCSSHYDLPLLATEIHRTFNCVVAGCTTAGEIIAPLGYIQKSLVAVGFYRPELEFTPWFIPSLREYVRKPTSPPGGLAENASLDTHFAFFMLDGVSMLEEKAAACLYRVLGASGMLIGGSAGDDLRFASTGVYHAGHFHEGAGLVALFQTSLPFRRFRLQNFEPTDIKMVITAADSEHRRVMEINGRPAAAEYARIVGVPVEELSLEIFAAYPLMLRVGGVGHVRSLQKVNSDGSLQFYSAVEVGLVLTMGRARSLARHLQQELQHLREEIPGLQLIIGCDCILRRLDLERKNLLPEANEVLREYPFIGFSTYGEIYSGMHVNQTLTGVAIGGGA